MAIQVGYITLCSRLTLCLAEEVHSVRHCYSFLVYQDVVFVRVYQFHCVPERIFHPVIKFGNWPSCRYAALAFGSPSSRKVGSLKFVRIKEIRPLYFLCKLKHLGSDPIRPLNSSESSSVKYFHGISQIIVWTTLSCILIAN